MLTYKIQLKNGTTIIADNVTDVWNNEYGISFDAGKKTVAYVPHTNLANYQLVETQETITVNQDWNAEEAIRITELITKSFMNGLHLQKGI